MAVDTGTMTVFQLIEAILPYIEGRGYSKSYVDGIKEVFNNLNQYCVDHGYSEFNAEIAQKFLCDRYKLSRDNRKTCIPAGSCNGYAFRLPALRCSYDQEK